MTPLDPEIQKRIEETVARISQTADHYPGVIVILNPEMGVVYMNRLGLQKLGTTLEDLVALGVAYHNRYFNEEEARHYIPRIIELIQHNDDSRIITFFQQVKTHDAPEWEWYLSSMKLLLKSESGIPLLYIIFTNTIDGLMHVNDKIEHLLEENSFLRKNQENFSRLTQKEKAILKLLAQGKSNAEISATLNITLSTAQTHRKNIKRKLQAESTFELTRYAQAFGLT